MKTQIKWSLGALFLITGMTAFCLLNTSAFAKGIGDKGRFCSSTADALLRACTSEVQDDYWLTVAKCTNVSQYPERAQCLADAKTSTHEGRQFCREQWTGRHDACRSLGENRYDPDFDPAAFDSDFANLTNPNPYFPLGIGNTWEYQGGSEINTLVVVNETKLIDGVTCIVVRDLVFDEGDLMESTDDWYAQARDGNVWYCGEEVKDYESFDGDNPRRPELVSMDGSFKAGRDGDKPGVIFRTSPRRGDVYLEEFSLGNAEDVTEILSTTYAFGIYPELDQYVPQQLAELLCSGDCIVTKNFSLLEPGIFAYKYYAQGIGFFLEVNPETGGISQLVNCNFDARCGILPSP